MHAVGVPVLLCSSVISLRERNKKRQGKARTSSKGERGSKGKDKQKARKLTHFIRRCVLRVTEQAKHDVAHCKAKTSQIASEKHEVRRRTKQSTTSSKQSSKQSMTSSKPSNASEAKHDSHFRLRLQFAKSFFCPPLRRSRRRGGRRGWAYNACASSETAAACGRDCPF